MLLATTDHLQDRRVNAFLGVVSGYAVVGENLEKSFSGGIRGIAAGHSHNYALELEAAQEKATQQMIERAKGLGANAIIGVDVDFEMSGGAPSLTILTINGTAIQVDGSQMTETDREIEDTLA